MKQCLSPAQGATKRLTKRCWAFSKIWPITLYQSIIIFYDSRLPKCAIRTSLLVVKSSVLKKKPPSRIKETLRLAHNTRNPTTKISSSCTPNEAIRLQWRPNSLTRGGGAWKKRRLYRFHLMLHYASFTPPTHLRPTPLGSLDTNFFPSKSEHRIYPRYTISRHVLDDQRLLPSAAALSTIHILRTMR